MKHLLRKFGHWLLRERYLWLIAGCLKKSKGNRETELEWDGGVIAGFILALILAIAFTIGR